MKQPLDIKRRQLMKLGAAGMPMMFTLKAQANTAIVSQLRCLITIPSGWKIMVNDQGAAWLGDFKVKKKMTNKDIEQAKDDSDFIFPAGTVPQEYRPDEDCSSEGDHDCGWGNDEDYDAPDDNEDWGSCDANPNRGTPWFEDTENGGDGQPGNSGRAKHDNHDHSKGHTHSNSKGRHKHDHDGIHSHDDDDDDWGSDDDDDDENAPCRHKIYEMSSNNSFPISDVVDEAGTWSLSGSEGLYILLAQQYAEQYGDTEGFPGVSCLLSVINYLNMNN